MRTRRASPGPRERSGSGTVLNLMGNREEGRGLGESGRLGEGEMIDDLPRVLVDLLVDREDREVGRVGSFPVG